MNIAISCHPTQGGSGIVATELAKALALRGHTIHVISCNKPYRLNENENIIFHPVDIPEYPLFKYPPHDLCMINKLQEVILAHDIDIVHSHYAIPHAICGIFAKQIVQPHPVKVVATMHGTDITLVGSHPGFHDLCRYAMLQCDKLTAVSCWLSTRTVKEFDLGKHPDVIYNFIDREKFNPQDRLPYPGDDPFVIMHASNFRPVKRTAEMVRVFYRIQQKLPARLILVGNGPDLELARELSGELGICHKIQFAGSQQNIEDFYKSSHLYLLLSHYESFGLSALEAMGCGLPVAVSNAGGLPEVVNDNENGLLCDGNDISGTADRIINLLSDKSRWEAMSCHAAEHAKSNFSVESIVPHYEKLYHEVLAS